MKKMKYFIASIVIVICLYFLYNFNYNQNSQPLSLKQNYIEFDLSNKNENIGKTLFNKKLIKDENFFNSLINKNKLVIGKYYLSASMNSNDIAKTLQGENVLTQNIKYHLNFNETINKFSLDLNNVLARNSKEFTSLAQNKDKIKKIAQNFAFFDEDKMLNNQIDYFIEGYLISGDYEFNLTWSYEKIITKFFEKTNQVYEKYKDFLKAKNLSFHGLLSLTSCLSAEVGIYTKQYKDVAGVFWNRINKNMPLQLDATFIYGYNHGVDTKNNVKDISIDKMQKEDTSNYNTYNKQGLPVGPITSISLEQIEAILNPNKHEYLYYYHYTDKDNNRKIKLAKTYEEHKNNIKR